MDNVIRFNLPENSYAALRFINADGKEVGCFNFSKSPATFSGDVDESAKIFWDWIIATRPNILDKNK